MQVACPSCGAFVEIEKAFCIRCGGRVIPLTEYDLSASDFIYPPDRDAMENLRSLEALSPIIDEFLVKRSIRSILSSLERASRRIEYSSRLGSMIRECGLILGLDKLPRAYLLESDAPTAFTFGTREKQFLAISRRLLEILDEGEVRAAIGHELGHVKCHHIKYHTLAELLLRGAELSLELAGGILNLISPALRLILLSWHRESEISADRAAALACGGPEKPISLLRKLEKLAPDNPALEPLSTHPTHEERVSRIIEYSQSPEYAMARKKIEWRLKIAKALTPFCRFCQEPKPLTSIFCPSCGRSQV